MIRFSNVTKRFGDAQPALSDVTFEVEPGELVVITGHSGSGKTTLMRLLTKEYEPNEGEVIFYDTPLDTVRSSKVHLHRRQIGVVFQDYRLLEDLNVWENIALALSIIGTPEPEIESRVTDLLRLVDIAEKAYHFPAQLSGGEAQRVSIARALSTGPKVIFADEPTGNLDQTTTRSIVELLKKINELGTTVMVTTHDPIVMDVLKKGHHLELDKGKLINDSRPQKKEKLKPTQKHEPTSELAEHHPQVGDDDKKTKKGDFFFSLPSFSLFSAKKSKKTELTTDEIDSISVKKPKKVDTNEPKHQPDVHVEKL